MNGRRVGESGSGLRIQSQNAKRADGRWQKLLNSATNKNVRKKLVARRHVPDALLCTLRWHNRK
eukprot:6206062-Pleurochrysis_carterae.AAC.2